MTDPTRDPGAILDPEAALSDRAGLTGSTEDEAVGYARADLSDALARIRATAGSIHIGDAERVPSMERSNAEERLADEVRALGAKVDRLVELAESARESTTSARAAAVAVEERLAGVTARIEEAQATQARADARLVRLSTVVTVLTVIVLALLVADIVSRLGS